MLLLFVFAYINLNKEKRSWVSEEEDRQTKTVQTYLTLSSI